MIYGAFWYILARRCSNNGKLTNFPVYIHGSHDMPSKWAKAKHITLVLNMTVAYMVKSKRSNSEKEGKRSRLQPRVMSLEPKSWAGLAKPVSLQNAYKKMNCCVIVLHIVPLLHPAMSSVFRRSQTRKVYQAF